MSGQQTQQSTSAAGRWTLAELADSIEAALAWSCGVLPDVHGRIVGCVRNDAREVEPGDLFVALAGTRQHGAAFASQAAERGAAAMLVGSDAEAGALAAAARELPLVVADDDGVSALGRLARQWRERCGFTVVGITGSTGKTSTKDILSSLLSAVVPTAASHANHNNEIGVPLTLLSAAPDAGVVVCEMGMRGLGQIRYLCEVAAPDVGIVTNAGAAHLALLGSVENIVRAKAELVAGVAPDGVAIVPADQPELLEQAAGRPGRVLTFGDAGSGADCEVANVEAVADGIAGSLTFQQRGLPFELPVHGAHQARNLAAATCALWAVTGELRALDPGLARFDITVGRGDRHVLPGGALLIDDSYNANPTSMRASLAALMSTPGERHVAVLGGMAELGGFAPTFHRELGMHAATLGLDELHVVTTLDDAAAIAEGCIEAAEGRLVPDVHPTVEDVVRAVAPRLAPGDVVLVKGSNSAGLREVVAALREPTAAERSTEAPV